jgi:sugar phosphate isomerase/epimerase
MRIASPGRPHLSYCTNIHPGESLSAVRSILLGHVVVVKQALSPDAPFGVGLRLSARAARELAHPGAREAFAELLRERGLYVFTVNGFPYGPFHGEPVKEAVYRPDWREPERLTYSDGLAWELAALLPEGVSGSVSTVPGAFRERATDADAATEIAQRLLAHAATLFLVRERTGKDVELCLEPEPCCFLETTDEVVRFFEEHVFARGGVQHFAALTGLAAQTAEPFLRRHLGMCLDACHLAVEFEDARDAVRRVDSAGIRIGKVQVTTALSVELSGDPRRDAGVFETLSRFADRVYLHQVVERSPAGLVRHLDLPEAIAGARAAGSRTPSEWRIHFHVPVFADRYGSLASTQPFLRDLLDIARERPLSEHFEVETYTWDVLPPEHRTLDVDHAIVRELEFTLGCLARGSAQ